MKYIVFLVACLYVTGAIAQRRAVDADPVYRTATTYGITANTNSGLIGGFSFRHSRLLDSKLFGMPQSSYLSIEAVNVKHPKEFSANTGYNGRFIAGKENFLFSIRGQYGRDVKLFERVGDEGIEVGGILAAGPTLGIIKPYYVQVQEGNRTYSVPAETLSTTGASGTPIGPGGFFEGFGNSKFTVGLNAKAGLSFDLSAFRNNITGLEIGFLAEVFPKRIPILPNRTTGADPLDGNRQFFTSGYITLFFGTRK